MVLGGGEEGDSLSKEDRSQAFVWAWVVEKNSVCGCAKTGGATVQPHLFLSFNRFRLRSLCQGWKDQPLGKSARESKPVQRKVWPFFFPIHFRLHFFFLFFLLLLLLLPVLLLRFLICWSDRRFYSQTPDTEAALHASWSVYQAGANSELRGDQHHNWSSFGQPHAAAVVVGVEISCVLAKDGDPTARRRSAEGVLWTAQVSAKSGVGS